MQEEKGYGYFKLEKHALNMLVAGPVLWVIGSIHNSCQIYERADGHVQILQQSVCIPFLMGSSSFMLSAILNHRAQATGEIHHGLHLLVSSFWTQNSTNSLMSIANIYNCTFQSEFIGYGNCLLIKINIHQ